MTPAAYLQRLTRACQLRVLRLPQLDLLSALLQLLCCKVSLLSTGCVGDADFDDGMEYGKDKVACCGPAMLCS